MAEAEKPLRVPDDPPQRGGIWVWLSRLWRACRGLEKRLDELETRVAALEQENE